MHNHIDINQCSILKLKNIKKAVSNIETALLFFMNSA